MPSFIYKLFLGALSIGIIGCGEVNAEKSPNYTPTDPCHSIECDRAATCDSTLAACVCSDGNVPDAITGACAEDCSNRFDDDADGLVDCADSDCSDNATACSSCNPVIVESRDGTCVDDDHCLINQVCDAQGQCQENDRSRTTFTDVILTENGSFIFAAGTSAYIRGDFLNSSTQNTEWDTGEAYLEFQTGDDDALHDCLLPSADLGRDVAGYTDNFAWHTVALESGNSLFLFDGNADPGGALYVREFLGLEISGATVTNVTSTDGLNVYYQVGLAGNYYLGGLDYALTGGGMLLGISCL